MKELGKEKQGQQPTQTIAERRKKMGFKKIVFALPLAALLSLPVLARAEEPDPAALQGKVDGLDERMATVESDVSGLKKVKISGYIQARYEYNQDSEDQFKTDAHGKTSYSNKDYFYVRRGRLKTTWEPNSMTSFLIQLDAAKDKVSLKDAEGTLQYLMARNYLVSLKAGQFKWPFSYDVLRSSSDREMPERTLAVRTLMPGERDRGIQLGAGYKGLLEFRTGIFNGYGIDNSTYPVITPSRDLAWVSRLALDLGWVCLAGSSFVGRAGFTVPGAVVGEATDLITRDKHRFGGDAQFFYALPYLGGGRLLAEVITGKDFSQSLGNGNGGYAPSLGYYFQVVQNILEKEQVTFRFDSFDPNTDKDDDRTDTFGLALLHNFNGNARFTLAYEIPKKEKDDKDDNKLTLQFQYKF